MELHGLAPQMNSPLHAGVIYNYYVVSITSMSVFQTFSKARF